jgi:hypothetical protein
MTTPSDETHEPPQTRRAIVTEKTDEWTFLYDQLGMSE